MNHARGTDINMVLMFLRSIRVYVDLLDGVDNIIAVWDSRLTRGQPNFRRQATEIEYKAGRNTDLLATAHEHDADIQQCIESLGGINMFPARMEADDVIAWLSHNLDHDITIVTVDQDMYQLINKNCQVYSPIKKIMVTEANFHTVTQVPTPEDFLTFKCLTGDKSDNIPGLPKVGKKTALKLLTGDLMKNLKERSAESSNIYENNKKLMDLSYGYTVHEGEVESYTEQLQQLDVAKQDLGYFKKLCFKNKLFAITTKFDNFVSTFNRSINSTNLIELISKLPGTGT